MQDRSSKPKRPCNINQPAARIVQVATGEVPERTENLTERKNPAAVALGRLGGKKGGPARAAKLPPKKRVQIAKKAALARWTKKPAPS